MKGGVITDGNPLEGVKSKTLKLWKRGAIMFKRTKKSLFVGALFAICFFTLVTNGRASTVVFINEIHYDNDGLDTGEAIEIFGPAGTDMSGWTVELYSGNDGESYGTITLTGTIPNQQNGFGTLDFQTPGIQNGAPDGLALVNNGSAVQFLSYEGAFDATDGPAKNWESIDIGVSEDPPPPAGNSLQLTGSGRYYEDFTWSAPMDNTFGEINTGQSAVPIPAALWLLGSGLIGLLGIKRKFRK